LSNSIVFSSIFYRPTRTLATILAIGLEVTLILIILGLTNGMIGESARRMEGTGADIILQPPGSSYFLATSTAAMPIKIAEVLRSIEGVRYVSPVLLQLNTQGGLDLIYGIDLETFSQVTGGFVFLSGSAFQGPQDVIIDDIYAETKKVKVGDPVKFLNHSFRVSGIVEHGKGSRVFLPIRTMQDLIGAPGKASLMFIKCTSGEAVPQVAAKLKERFKGYKVSQMADFVTQISSASNNLVPLRYFINIVTLIAILVGFFAIFLAMYTTISERTREIGILKSMGASKVYVLGLFMKEALLLGALGLFCGIGLSFGAELLLKKLFPNLQIDLSLEWMVKAAFIALVSAALGAFYPALRAAAKDPIEALAYE
jgi:putative ABC transport system permease protein